MLENLLFSFNMILPLFTLLALGFLLARKGLFTEDYAAKTTDLVYYVLLPGKLFLDTAAMDIHTALAPHYLAVTAAGVVLQFLLAWACGSLLCPERRSQSAFAHACFRGNFAYMGMALLQNIYGTDSVASTAAVVVLVLPLYNIQGILLMTLKERRGSIQPGALLLAVLKNPMVLAILAGLPLAWLQLELPFAAAKSLDYLRSATSTMALLLVGASIRLEVLRTNLGRLLRICGVKLLVMPAVWAAMALLAGLTPEQTVTLTVVGAMPTAVNAYIVTGKLGGDGELACGAVVLSHLLSLFSMTVIVFLLKSTGLI